MSKIFLIFKKYLAFTGIILLLSGLLFSNALISIGIILIFINTFIEQKPIDVFNKIKDNKLILLFLLLYLMHLTAFFYTENTHGFLYDIRIKLPLLLLPIGLTSPSLYSKKAFIRLHVFFILIVFVTALISTTNYLLNFSEINKLILKSKPLPIFGGINHIYFGFFLAYSVLVGIFIHFKYGFQNKYLKIFWTSIIVLNIVFIHIIASRTGFITLYAALLFGGIHLYMIKQKRYISGFTILALIVVTLILSVNYIKPLKNRYNNTIKDIEVILEDKNRNYWSLAQRYEAIIKAWEVFELHPVIGTGMGDLPKAIEQQYEGRTWLLFENRKMPHNQFLTYIAGMGIIGLLIFLIIILFPLFIKKLRNEPFITGFWFAMVLALLFESMLQRQVGVTFFAFFWVYLNNKIQMKEELENESK